MPSRSVWSRAWGAQIFTRRLGIVSFAALTLVAVFGCQRPHKANVLATVNGKPIYRAEVERRYEDSLGDSHQQPSKVQASIMKLNILRTLIDDEIVMQQAAKQNLVASDSAVMDKLNQIKAPFSKDQFQKQLDSQHMTLAELKERIRRGLTEQKLINKEITSRINITDADITKFYNAHQVEFDLPQPAYHLARIIVTSQPMPPQQVGNLQNSKAMNAAEARRKIQTLHNELESGQDFGALAMNFSEDPNTSGNGGDMGIISESQLKQDPQVYAAIAKLKPGQITNVLPIYAGTNTSQPVGYAIYKLIDSEPAGQRQLSDPRVQQAIRQRLRESQEQLLKNAYLEVLRDQAHVVNYYAQQIFRNGAQ